MKGVVHTGIEGARCDLNVIFDSESGGCGGAKIQVI